MPEPAVVDGPLVVRAWVAPTGRRGPRERQPQAELVLVLDCETRTDPAQALTFRSYRVYRSTGKLVREGLIYGERLTEIDFHYGVYPATESGCGSQVAPTSVWWYSAK
jgi:hypothetical protein